MPEIQVVEEILAGHRLPTLPAVAAEVLEMTAAPEIDLQKIADTVQLDQALAAKVSTSPMAVAVAAKRSLVPNTNT